MINKEECLVGLLTTCTLNNGDIRDYAYHRVFGDKETFWLGFEAVNEQYQFSPRLPGAMGPAEKTDDGYKICARQLMHLSPENEEPLWINGGIAESKYEKDSPVAKLEDWVVEPGKWELHANNLACLTTGKRTMVEGKLAKVIKESGNILLADRQ